MSGGLSYKDLCDNVSGSGTETVGRGGTKTDVYYLILGMCLFCFLLVLLWMGL